MPVDYSLPVLAAEAPQAVVMAGCTDIAEPGIVRISAIPNCLAPHERWTGTTQAGLPLVTIMDTVCDMAHIPSMLRGGGTIWLNGVPVEQAEWDTVTANDGDSVEFVVAPRGNAFNSILKVIGAVVGIILSVCFAGISYPILGAILGMGASIGISLLADAIAPIRTPKVSLNDDFTSSPTYSLNASSNDMRPGSPVCRMYGQHVVACSRILDDYTEILGQDEYLYFWSVIGYGPLEIDDIRLGETSLELYDDVRLELTYGRAHDPAISLVPHVVYQESMQAQLVSQNSAGSTLPMDDWWITRSTVEDVDGIGIDIQAPSGLYSLDDHANRNGISLGVQIRYRLSAPTGGQPGPWLGAGTAIPARAIGFSSAWYAGGMKKYGRDWYYEEPVQLRRADLVYVDAWGTIGLVTQKINTGIPSGCTLLCTVVIYGLEIESVTPSAYMSAVGMTVTKTGPLVLSFSAGKINEPLTRVILNSVAGEPDKAVRQTIKWRVPSGKYDVQVRRASGQSTSSRVVDTLYWTALRGSDSSRKPYTGTVPLAQIAMRIKATNQLSGRLPVVSMVCTSILPDWDPATKKWVERSTRNPAAHFLDVLKGAANSRPRSTAEIHYPSLQQWSEWCAANGYLCDIVYDTQSRVWDVLCDIAACGRGCPALIEGKWGVTWQHKQEGLPAGHITVRNSRDYKSSRVYHEEIHGLRIKYRNAAERWESAELAVYAPGYNAKNASLFETIELMGTTDEALAAVRGKWHLSQALLLGETYQVTMPLEYLMLQKGQKVRVVRPEMLYGIGAAAFKSLTRDESGQVTSLLWDAELPMTPGTRYMAVVRLQDNSEWTVTGTSDDGRNMKLDKLLALPDPAPRPGDLVMVGSVEEVGRFCLVTSIKPGDNLTATISMCDYVDELYENDGGKIPEYDAAMTLPGIGPRHEAKAPDIEIIRSDESALLATGGGAFQARIWLCWRYNDSSTGAQVQYRFSDDGDWRYVDSLPLRATEAYISDVREGAKYDVRLRAINDRGWPSPWVEVTNHLVTGKLNPPPDVQGLALSIDSPTGVRVAWDALEIADLSHYIVSGALSGKTTDTSITIAAPNKKGTLSLSVKAVDTGGRTSKNPATASIVIHEPQRPEITAAIRSNGLRVEWQDCTRTWPIRQYVVTDVYENRTERLSAEGLLVTPRPQGEYEFLVTAVDIFGNSSLEGTGRIEVPPISTPEPVVSVDQGDMVLTWPAVTSAFTLTTYQIITEDFQAVGETNSTFYRFPCPLAGVHEFRVRAVDVADNMSGWGECSFPVTAPPTPKVAAKLDGDGVLITWNSAPSMLPVTAWEVERVERVERVHILHPGTPEQVIQVESYGTLDVTQTRVPAMQAGEHSFRVRSRDSAGNASPYGETLFTVRAPGRVSMAGTVVDNNVLLYWTAPDRVFFPIREYIFAEVQDGYSMEIGRVDALFGSVFENASGSYTYRITPVDVAGNLGMATDYTTRVAQPPDFIFYYDKDSLFNGEKNHCVLDHRGGMIGPVPEGETWVRHMERLGQGVWQAKIDAGYKTWLEPGLDVGTYTEVVDTGLGVPSTKVTITPTYAVLAGNPVLGCEIEVSEDNETWRTLATNGWQVFATAFRYLRYTLTVSGGVVRFANINCCLDVKRLTDFGSASCAAEDNAPDFVDMVTTPMLAGTWVPFNVAFTDVESLPKPNVRNAETLTAYTVFVDTPFPQGFRIFVLDKNGQRVSATVDWVAYGV